MKKKGITQVVTLSLLLLVVVSTFMGLGTWYSSFSNSYQLKQDHDFNGDLEEVVEILEVQTNDEGYDLVLKSLLNTYVIIDSIKINGLNCSFTKDNVILANSISYIGIDCSSYTGILKSNIFTEFGVLSGKVKLK